MENAIGIVFLVSVIATVIYGGFWEARRTGQLITPLSLFLALCAADVFLPALNAVARQNYVIPEWASPLSTEVILRTSLLFSLSAFLFVCGYFVVQKTAFPSTRTQFKPLSLKWLGALFLLCAGFYATSIFFEMRQSGGAASYLNKKMLRILIQAAPLYPHGIAGVIIHLWPAFLKSAYLIGGIAFYFRFRSRYPIVVATVSILLCFLLAATTFFRGALLALGLCFLVLENQRLQEKGSRLSDLLRGKRSLLWVPIACLLAFVGYGTIRNYFQVKASRELLGWQLAPENVASAFGDELDRFLHGPSLQGLASVTEYFSVPEGRLNGKTLKDMLLLPFPRSIYKDKPDWYGIDDIARSLRWPDTTQSAISMPGELYANFGPKGLCLMLAYGMFFGLLFRFSSHPYFRLTYPFVFIPMMLVTFWMSLTGLMNELIHLPLVLIVGAIAAGMGSPSFERASE